MKTIYVAKDKDGTIYEYESVPELRRGQAYYPTGIGSAVKANVFDIDLYPLEVVKVHIDTDKGTFVVERTRKDGIYAATTECKGATILLEYKDNAWHYYSGCLAEYDVESRYKIGKNPIPKECLPC